MKYSTALLALIGLAAAAPSSDLARRQITSDELIKGGCKKVVFVWARASTEPGNMGMSMGPIVCSGLKKKFGSNSVACQGVGGPYSAGLMDNVRSDGTTEEAVNEAVSMFTKAIQCEGALVVGGGYSQGTAVTGNAVMKLDSAAKEKVLGIVLYGYTKNGQTKGSIPGYPSDRLKVFCRDDDGVCDGQLMVTIGHFGYLMDDSGDEGIAFLTQKIQAASSG
ncbi:putative cutinase [Eremomyces bilateralis CBS 781.70]|uniref:Cutinase n=1 Tax=Eremomyces bilateralis CBS 781.70 TaxID=1392243 RepID=A0A6G1GB05_9PEZI|nr:putative cutinase [Eremomyces bilateralis CBS 781.70]KAF1815091.1 putative cutinase [Eremomyces bilateralis CBS 781.70]